MEKPVTAATVDAPTFRALRELAYQQAGIALRENKEALVSARVAKRVRTLGLAGPKEYVEYLRADGNGEEMIHFLDAISTNFTSFYREADHFEILSAHARGRLAEGRERLRLWCAASSSGEEPYTLAMTLAQATEGANVDWRILATDISVRVLEAASRGEYEQSKLANVPKALRARYFEPLAEAGGGEALMRVRPELREHLVFKRLNLARPPFPMAGQLDAVFCRNVMIYFDLEVRTRLILEIERLLLPGGLLAIGHAETLNGIPTSLKMIKPSVYRKASG
jgi:chemotaxis protein methyltransferase CheR